MQEKPNLHHTKVHGCFNDLAFVIQPADLICVPKILTSSSTVTTTLIFLKHFLGFLLFYSSSQVHNVFSQIFPSTPHLIQNFGNRITYQNCVFDVFEKHGYEN
jgi:hypothetical protein